jgi:hypothetical protein
MSQVTMCDFCGRTGKGRDQFAKVKFPASVVSALRDLGSSAGSEWHLDVCAGCEDALASTLDRFAESRMATE